MSHKRFTVMLLLCSLVFTCACSKISWKTERTYELRTPTKFNLSKSSNVENVKTQHKHSFLLAENSTFSFVDPALKTNRSRYTSAEYRSPFYVWTAQHSQQTAKTSSSAAALLLAQVGSPPPQSQEIKPSLEGSVRSCIHLNESGLAELITLPGIGEKRARIIIDYRSKHPFKRKSDITKIKGIGKKTYAKLSPLLCDL